MPRKPAAPAEPTPAERIRAARAAASLTQAELAFTLGLHVNFVSDLERGVRSASAETALRLADVLGIDPRTLRPDLPWDAVVFADPLRRTCNRCNVVRPSTMAVCPACGSPEFRLPPGA